MHGGSQLGLVSKMSIFTFKGSQMSLKPARTHARRNTHNLDSGLVLHNSQEREKEKKKKPCWTVSELN